MIVAEFGSFVLSSIFLIAKRKQYKYFEKVPLFGEYQVEKNKTL